MAHTRVYGVHRPHSSHVYSVQSTNYTMDRERELEIVLSRVGTVFAAATKKEV